MPSSEITESDSIEPGRVSVGVEKSDGDVIAGGEKPDGAPASSVKAAGLFRRTLFGAGGDRLDLRWVSLLTFTYFVIVVRTAWIGDDTVITLRTVLNFVNGFGPVFNVGERVQAYTHPVWFFLIAAATKVLGNVFYAAYAVSIVTTVGCFWLLITRLVPDRKMALLVTAACVTSKSFVDYSASGLENPMSHLLVISAVLFGRRALEDSASLTAFGLSCATIFLNRPDVLLVVFPLGLFVLVRSMKFGYRPLLKAAFLSAVPVVLWLSFSVFYYGLPVPNTALAKLGAGLTLGERAHQGAIYFVHTVMRDPVTVLVIVFALLTAVFAKPFVRALACGVSLYLVYIFYIGGDFMEGRFFSVPFFVSLIILCLTPLSKRIVTAVLVALCALSVTTVHANVIAGSKYENRVIYVSGIADERGYYYHDYGLLPVMSRGGLSYPEWELGERKTMSTCGFLGSIALLGGPSMHLVDQCALADPLLSRLPAVTSEDLRVGHYLRVIPDGYLESQFLERNLLADSELGQYWESIRLVTSGSLTNGDRLRAIWDLNFSDSDNTWQRYREGSIFETSGAARIFLSQISDTPVEPSDTVALPGLVFGGQLIVQIGESTEVDSLEFSVDGADYVVSLLVDGRWVEVAEITGDGSGIADALTTHRVDFDTPVRGVESIGLTNRSTKFLSRLGHIRIDGQ